ncbi:FecR family protein [uncultured Lutibacter sp.]|uniref:FecR family protein n=1 Tax=uncultured Lutibacter sp. TaxID=437739 RepID=UPI00261EB62B|nr:FecR domain-containing protein [uncultured Lutibacter sp.]
MIPSKIENVIVKYLTKSASVADLDLLTEWIKTPSNKQLFKDFIQTHYTINYSLNNPDSKKLIEQLLLKIRKDKTILNRFKRNSIFKYAAIFIALIGITYFINSNFKQKQENDLVITDNDIILKLDDGKVKIISSDGSEKLVNDKGEVIGIQKGNQLNYSETESDIEKLAFNELTVPNGKIFDLVLSDGTRIKLNAGSSIKYPVKFLEGKDRIVYLNGEAFFDVTKDQKHPFIVNANEINIRVLGTQFNVSSYPEDQQINTVLVEGAVSIYNKEEAYNKNTASLLTSGHKAEWVKNRKSISIEEADTSIYTAWMDGKLIFKDLPFKTIIKKLERRYNVTIENNNELLGEKRYDGTFDIETIEQVLNTLNKHFAIQYTIKNNQIIIN